MLVQQNVQVECVGITLEIWYTDMKTPATILCSPRVALAPPRAVCCRG